MEDVHYEVLVAACSFMWQVKPLQNTITSQLSVAYICTNCLAHLHPVPCCSEISETLVEQLGFETLEILLPTRSSHYGREVFNWLRWQFV